jgi:putative membrane protein
MDLWFWAELPPLNTADIAWIASARSKMFRALFETIRVPIVRSTAATITTLEANNMNLVPLGNIVAALAYAFIGILIFILSFVIIDKATPYHLWKEIVQEHNMALAILIGAMSIGICIIIAAAIH